MIFEKNFDIVSDVGLKLNNFDILKKIETYINQRGGQMIVLELPTIIDIQNKNFFERVIVKLCTDTVYKSYGKKIFDGELFFDDFRKKDFKELVKNNIDLYKNCFDNYSDEYVTNVAEADPELVQSNSFFIMEDYNSNSINVENGIRLEKNLEDKKNNIFMFGASNAFGYYVSDEETITAYLRKYDLGNYNVYNCATNGDTMINIYNRILNFDIEKNDIVIIGVLPVVLKNNFDLFASIRTMDYFEQPHNKENFVDTAHYTAFCHRNLAKIIYDSIKKMLVDNKDGSISKDIQDSVNKVIDEYKQIIQNKGLKIDNDSSVGIAVMSANPFTLGHRHLVEIGSKMFDCFVVFLMQDGYDLVFNKQDCQDLVRVGAQDLNNVVVVPFPDGIITYNDFCPEYNNVAVRHSKNFIGINVYDLGNALIYLCKKANFSHYIAGIETNDTVTRQMTLHFKHICELNGINFIYIPRKKMEVGGKSISASECRKLLQLNQHDKLLQFLQPVVLQYIIDKKLSPKKQDAIHVVNNGTRKILKIYEKDKEQNMSKYLNMIGVKEPQYLNAIKNVIIYVNALDILNKNKKEGLELLLKLYNQKNNMSAWAGYQYIMNTNIYHEQMVDYVFREIKDEEHKQNILEKVKNDN